MVPRGMLVLLGEAAASRLAAIVLTEERGVAGTAERARPAPGCSVTVGRGVFSLILYVVCGYAGWTIATYSDCAMVLSREYSS